MNFSDSDSIEGTEVFIKKDNSKSKEFGEYLLGKMVKGFKISLYLPIRNIIS